MLNALDGALAGWTIIGFASTFLIGGFNDRPTARDNATFVFAVYQLAEVAMLVFIAFAERNRSIAAASLLAGCLLKVSLHAVTRPLHHLAQPVHHLARPLHHLAHPSHHLTPVYYTHLTLTTNDLE